ncbi:hypothetical protein DPMN_172484 [Dreissena polymorpha]|uniref:Uncharacterized protein n=1 Tax=Dreissena polymorpha TaxID=45954 RepID=A0A9D4E3R2_DREPO|nr:hypothetical protein DPMN_172484 [Dreissena polymorpha]
MILPTFMHSEHPGGHVFQQTRTILAHIHDIIKTNMLRKCHEDWTINVTLRVLTRFDNIVTTNLLTKFHENQTINVARLASRVKNAPLPYAHVFQPTTNVLTKFHDDRTINVASRVLTRNAPPPFGHALQPT